MSNLDDRIGDALRDLDARVAHAVHRPRSVRPRPLRFVVPVVAALAVLAVLVGSVVIGRQQDRAVSVVPSGTSSQSPEDAARDGVYPQIADLTSKQRTGKVLKSALSTVGKQAITLELVRPDLRAVKGFGADGCLAPVDADRAYPVCRNGQYTELLAFAAGTRRIVHAYPLPAKMTWMMGIGDYLYCGHDGTQALPDSALCRLDLRTLDLTGTVFQCDERKDTCGQGDQALSRYPGTWFENPKIAGAARVFQYEHTDQLLVKAADGRTTAELDPESLKPLVTPTP